MRAPLFGWLCSLLVGLGALSSAAQPAFAEVEPELIAHTGHSSGVVAVAFTPDGRRALTAGDEGTVRLWDLESGREVRVLSHDGDVWSAALAPDGRRALSAGDDDLVRLWDLETGRELRALRIRSYELKRRSPTGTPVFFILSVAFSHDGRRALLGGTDGVVRLWDLETGRELRVLHGDDYSVSSVAFTPDGRRALTAGDKGVRLWDLESGREVRVLSHDGAVASAALAPDGRRALSVRMHDGLVRLWDLETGRELRALHSVAMVVAFSPDGRRALSGGGDGTVRLWDLDSGHQLLTVLGHKDLVNSVAFSPDGRRALSGGTDGVVRLWDLETGRELQALGREAADLEVALLSPDGRRALFGGGADGTLRLWDLENGKELHIFRRDSPFSAHISSVAFSPDGRRALSGGWDGMVRLWDLDRGSELRIFGHGGPVHSVSLLPDGRRALSAGDDGLVRLWDLETGRGELRTLRLGEAQFRSVAWAPDGRRALSGGFDGTVRLWDLETGRELRTLRGHKEPVVSVAFLPGGHRAFSADSEGTVRLWDLDSGRQLKSLGGFEHHAPSIAFSPDGLRALSGGIDGMMRLWDLESGKELRAFSHGGGSVHSVGFLSGGHRALSGGRDSIVRLWELDNGRELLRLVGFRGGSWVVAAPDGRFDTDNLDRFAGVHWLMPDDRFRPLPAEIFMRDYYEPRLMPRLLGCNEAELTGNADACAREFRPVRPLAELNRAQPKVAIGGIAPAPGGSDEVEVTVTVEGVRQAFGESGEKVWESGAYDLRLFRDGQLVGQYPEFNEPERLSGSDDPEADLAGWREAHEIVEGVGKERVPRFRVRLPHRSGKVEFTAYAFNADRVKSTTARTSYELPEGLPPRKGRAYIIAVGVSAYEDPAWDLRYADDDARRLLEVLPPQLRATGQYADVVAVPLLADWADEDGDRKVTVADATKESFEAVLDVLAGRRDSRELEPWLGAGLAGRLKPAQPEDLVLVAYSSHGYADRAGNFYLFPYDIGSTGGRKVVTDGLLERTISSAELALWLRDLDAGELVLVVDACHSAASVESPEFKPGPMGSRGLGQLAYDKGMRILASTRADDVAWESPKTKQGLLSYALVQEGLAEGKADLPPADGNGTTTLREWLQYPVDRLPALYEEAIARGDVTLAGYDAARATAHFDLEAIAAEAAAAAAQQPSLFDFRRGAVPDTVVARTANTMPP